MKAPNKIKRAFVEGRVLAKATKKLVKHADITIGNHYRKRYAKKIKVIDNQIFFYTFQGAYTCNPKYISDELIRRGADVKIVWGLKNPRSLPGSQHNSKNVAFIPGIYEYYEAAMSSKILITNSTIGEKNHLIPIKKDQVLIETWHGSLGIKKFDPKAYKSSKDWPRAMARTGKMTSYCISNSAFEDDVYRDTFWNNQTQILRFGHPRNDILFGNNKLREKLHKSVVEKFNLPKYKDIHFVMYGPTFRDDHGFEPYDLDFDKTLDAFNKRFGGEWYMLLRYHPTVLKEEYLKNKLQSERVVNLSDYPDIQELMLICDAGISDYSSWMFDYMLTRKPMFVLALDYDKYKDERTFYYPLESTPFPIAKTNDEMAKNVLEFDDEKYVKEVNKFIEEKGCVDDGHASERVVDLILKIIEESKQKKKEQKNKKK